MDRISAHFEHWLRLTEGAASGSTTQVLESNLLVQGTPFRWISYSDSAADCRRSVTVDLWALRAIPTDRPALGEVCGSLELANCHLDEIGEGYVVRGLAVTRLVVIRANLVSPSVQADPVLAEVAQSGSRIRLWTYSISPSSFEVFPYCPAPVRDADRPFHPLTGVLSKLSAPLKLGGSEMVAGVLPGERRRFERRPVSARASVAIEGGGGRIRAARMATLSDLSARGACLTGFSLRAGLGALKARKVVLRSAVGGRPFLARGSVVRFHVERKSTTLGIRFSGRPTIGEGGAASLHR